MSRALSELRLPIMFEANKGQFSEDVLFSTVTEGMRTLFYDNKIVLKKGESNLAICFGEAHGKVIGRDLLIGKVNYFIGKDKRGWINNVTTYSKIVYEGLFNDVQMVCYGTNGQLEIDFEVAPGGDYREIKLTIPFSQKIEKNQEHNIILTTDSIHFKLMKPHCYQVINDERIDVLGDYIIEDTGTIRLNIGTYDRNQMLTIDPVISYSTYLGGLETQFGEGSYGIEVDQQGNTYIVGYTSAGDFPVIQPYQSTLNGNCNIIVCKWNNNNQLIYSTYIGGSGLDYGLSLFVDAQQNISITGNTSSPDFPIVSPYQGSLNGEVNAFVTKISNDGSQLLYSTYLGGSKTDYGMSIQEDTEGNLYIGGDTDSLDFPTQNAYQPFLQGIRNAFLTKIASTGDRLVFSTYLGGKGIENLTAIVLDEETNIYLTGSTSSLDYPVYKAFQPTLGGKRDAYITGMSSSGANLIFSTFFGGLEDDFGNDLDIDSQGNLLVTGSTQSSNIPIKNAYQPQLQGTSNAFILKMSSTTGDLIYATYLGGTGFDYANCITLDENDNTYITGGTTSVDFPIVNPIQSANAGTTDVFVSKMDVTGQQLLFSTYLGGSEVDIGNCISTGVNGDIVVTGVTYSTNFPTQTPYQDQLIGVVDIFVLKLQGGINMILSKEASNKTVYVGETLTYTIKVQITRSSEVNNIRVVDVLPNDISLVNFEVSQGIVRIIGQRLIWEIPHLSNEEEAVAQITVKALKCSELINTATAFIGSEWAGEASVTVNVVAELTTGPVRRGYMPKRSRKDVCGWVQYASVSLIQNTTSKEVYVDVYLYKLGEFREEVEGVKSVLIPALSTQTVWLKNVPMVYEVVFDKVQEGVLIWTSVKGKYLMDGSIVYKDYLQSNTFSHTQLINRTDC